ncbi:cupin domain-containing protein [Telmatospirillum sp. J64-1]|uniref:cupin domain-containing protein n=1 Tax=Telmatospirillum sp. J64-1 TaxID=2502183 RepID=UPI00351B077D
MLTAEKVIALLDLVPHPEEGGFFRETWRAGEGIEPSALPGRYTGRRSFGTAIYYLLTPGTFSHLHRLKSDEVFHFYLGDPVEQLHLNPDGTSRRVVLGTDLEAGQSPQVVVPAGVWQGARLVDGGRLALLGCTVAPGFEFADYDHGKAEDMLAGWPDQAELIGKLTA